MNMIPLSTAFVDRMTVESARFISQVLSLGSLGRRKKEVILAKDSLTAVSFRNGLQQQLGVKQLGKHYRHGNPSHAVLVQAFIWNGLWLNSWFLKFSA